jgi:hypothetical protein
LIIVLYVLAIIGGMTVVTTCALVLWAISWTGRPIDRREDRRADPVWTAEQLDRLRRDVDNYRPGDEL